MHERTAERGSAALMSSGTLLVQPIGRMSDIDEAVSVLGSAHRAAGTMSDRFAHAAVQGRLAAALIGAGSGAFLLARVESGEVVGIVGVDRSYCSAVGWELGYLAVKPAWQGCGIGRHLIARAVEHVLEQTPFPAFVLARAGNPWLFEQAGFRRIEAVSPSLMLRTF